MSQTLYVVMGTTGEYSDRSEWPVRAFATEAGADAFVSELDEWLRVHRVHMDQRGELPNYHDRGLLAPELDPKFECDYTGTSYWIMTVPLDDDVRADIAQSVAEDVRAGRMRRGIALEGLEKEENSG